MADITGGPAGDVLVGSPGDDNIVGGGGADTMSGGAGNDRYTVDDPGDLVVELVGEGNDTVLVDVTAGLVGYTLDAAADVETLQALDPASTAFLYLYGNDFAQTIRGNAGTNLLYGGGGADVLYGYDGADELNGGAGADTMVGGAGDDYYIVDDAGDRVIEAPGEGYDQVASYLSSYTLEANVESLQFMGDAVLGVGNALDNVISATSSTTGATLRGLGGNDAITGGAGNDTIEGGSGIDVLTGGGGNDLFRDTAAGLDGDTITDFAPGDTIQIIDASLAGFSFSFDGTALTFAGGTLTLPGLPSGYHFDAAAAASGVTLRLVSDAPPPAYLNNGLSGDFNGDGKSDLLWRSDAGQLSNWLGQANGGFVGNDANAFTSVAINWRIVGTGDFNGDGRDDILWRSDAGELSNWLGKANGGFVGNDANAFASVPTNWHVAGTGDFNGDGRDDILWRSDAGELSNWLGQANGGFAGNDAHAFTAAPTDWHVVGTGDFNGDGRDDILWRSDRGELSNWLGQANGGFAGNDAHAFSSVPTDWHIVGTGDFNGDGRADILWRSDAGLLSDWLGQANGGFAANDAHALTSVPTSWTVAGTGDFNGDGRSDIVWRSASGEVSNWLGTASGGFTANDSNAYSRVDTSWRIQSQDFLVV